MKKTLLTLALTSGFVIANPQSAMVDMLLAQMKQDGELSRLSQCIGLSEAKLEDTFKRSLNKCMESVSMDDDEGMEQCMKNSMTSLSGKSEAEFNACESEASKQEGQLDKIGSELVALEQKVEMLYQKEHRTAAEEREMELLESRIEQLAEKQIALSEQVNRASMSKAELALEEYYEQLGDQEVTAAQQKKLEQLQSEVMKENEAELKMMFNAVSQASAGTTDSITLPIYKNSKVIMHMQNTSEMAFGEKTITTLPAATFSSTDSVQSIANFYKKELPNFQIKTYDDGMVVMMEKMPKDFDVLTHLELYASTPHISISKSDDSNGMMPKGTQAVIEIAYRR